MNRLMIAVLLVMAFALPAAAQAVLFLSSQSTTIDCDVADPGPGQQVVVYVLLRLNPGSQGVAFAAPLPANSGLVHLYDTPTPPFLTVGSTESGVEVYFTSCVLGDLVVMAMHFLRIPGGEPCPLLYVNPHPDYDSVVEVDCNFNTHRTLALGVALNSDGSCNRMEPPYNPGPADGATDVPLFTNLTWDLRDPVCEIYPSGRFAWVNFGTTTPPPQVAYWVGSPYAVGPLEPATTYYWKVGEQAYGHSAVGPIWSFRTAAVVGVETSTWGRIKALYR